MCAAAMQAVGAQQASLFVTVVAPESGPLKSLTAKDFIARGAQAEVVGAVRPGALLSVELVVDISRQPYGPNPPIEDLRSALQAFVQTIRSGDPSGRIALMQVGNAAETVVDFDAPASSLDKAIDTITPGPEMRAVLIEGVHDAGRALARNAPPRRAIVSVDFATPDSIPGIAAEAIVKDVFTSGASVWAISVRGTGTQPATRENALNMIVKGNGGVRLTINASSGLKSQLQMVANSLLSQYELTIAGVNALNVRDLKITTMSGARVISSVFVR
jgi:hypothetical protein